MSNPSPPLEANGSSGELRSKTKMIKEAEAKMAEMSISKPMPVMAHNIAPGTLGMKINVQTNAFGLGIEKDQDIFMYDICIHAELPNGKSVEFTKKGKDDNLVNERRTKSIAIMKACIAGHEDIFGKDLHSVWYDGQAILFAAKDLLSGGRFKNLTVPGSSCGIPDLKDLACVVDVKATEKTKINFSANAVASNTANVHLKKNDHALTQFMEIVLNQAAIMNTDRHVCFENGKTFMVKPWDEGFNERDCPDVTDGKRLMVGTQKSVRQIEGPRGRGVNNPAVIIDAKKAAFHEAMEVTVKANKICQESFQRPVSDRSLEKLNTVMKGLFVSTTYTGRTRTFQIMSISKNTALTAFFEMEGGVKTSVSDYFLNKYKITLRYPNAPLLVTKERGKTNTYPMEVCNVNPLQRVTIPQQTPEQSQICTRNCAVAPSIRQANIMKGAKALDILSADNPYIKGAGLRVYAAPIKVSGRVLPEPTMVYGGTGVDADGGKWKVQKGKYLIPAKVTMWAMYAINKQGGRDQIDSSVLNQFGEKFYKECKSRGMEINPPAEIQVIGEADVHEKLRAAAKHNCQLCFFVSADGITSLHANLKLWERELEIVTQDMKMSNAIKVVKENKWQTMENVVLKTNIKLGGLNYSLNLNKMSPNAAKWLHPGRLVLGIGLSHPPPNAAFSTGELAPTVLGYAANMKENPFDYVGDFIFQETRREEMLPTMHNVVKVVVERFKAAHNQRPPSELVIYRAGIAEGSFATVISYELPLIRGILETIGAKETKLTFIVAQKEHTVRLMLENINAQDRPTAQNIRSGCVVDQQLTHPSFREFYLNSHITLQGSARTPRYTVLVDDSEMSMDEVQGMTYALAHNHQIVALTTSLPAPLYIANRYAERGRAMLGAHSSTTNEASSSDSSHDFNRLTEKLGYRTTRLANFRVNA